LQDLPNKREFIDTGARSLLASRNREGLNAILRILFLEDKEADDEINLSETTVGYEISLSEASDISEESSVTSGNDMTRCTLNNISTKGETGVNSTPSELFNILN